MVRVWYTPYRYTIYTVYTVCDERTIVYYKGRVWVEACLYDADVLICRVSVTRRGDVLRDVLLTRRGYGMWYSYYGSCVR